jgi:hypothetical protein
MKRETSHEAKRRRRLTLTRRNSRKEEANDSIVSATIVYIDSIASEQFVA